MMKRHVCVCIVIAAAVGLNAAAGIDQKDLTLEAAIGLALESNPMLKAAAHGVSAADERVIQAGLWPNPNLDLEIENFGGDSQLRRFESAESTLVLSQPLPLGGKPGRRRAVAESVAQLARTDLEALRLDVVAQTTARFYGVIAAQQRRDLTIELLAVSENFDRTVRARVEAGKVSPVESIRAKIEVSQARVALARANRALNAARTQLAATWGPTRVPFERAVGILPDPVTPPPIGELREMMNLTPENLRLEEEIEREERVLAFEKALAIPDLALGLGPRRYEETGQSAWVAGLAVSLPIFDRNQGARKAAAFELEQRRRETEGKRVALEADLDVLVEGLLAAAEAARSMKMDVLPASTAALAAVETGYREGKFGFIDVIAAQRAFFEANTLLLDSLEEYVLVRTDLERMVGRSLESTIEKTLISEDDGE